MNKHQKPEMGAPCTRCGVCCLATPCPLALDLGATDGRRCPFLQWDNDGAAVCPLVRLSPALVGFALGVGLGCDAGPDDGGHDDALGLTGAEFVRAVKAGLFTYD